ncbi:hypothetical protein [Brachybacterium sp. GU-2]|uniref:hypothetical protein n=1 Tax=Brachybacterium sp. GU-2 TaxID=3069708 RepID=UPI00280AB7A4|nr:hypothetical protein [Brachybacterium sp. GU-2]WME22120.1 hypothetical protein RBL05_11300 [Brachybacterium sp. GU-2]
MTSKTITDRAGDTVRLSTGSLTAGPGEITVKVSERFRGREEVAAVHVDPAALRAALDEVAPSGSYARTDEPLGAYTRHESPDYADGGVAAALIEKEAEERATICTDKDAHWRLDEALETIERLTRERDEARRERGEALDRLCETSHSLTPDAITDEMVKRARREADGWGHQVSDVGMCRILAAALTEPPARPEWLDAPAVRAWHKRDGRTERDGTPGKPRIWSPDYGTTETWSTPSLREVPWTDLVDVEPLDVSADLAEGLDRVAEFMRTGGVRVVGEDGGGDGTPDVCPHVGGPGGDCGCLL